MIKANVGLSRKLSRDYNSSGFTLNLEGEITAPASDPEAVLEQVRELYDLAEEALAQQIERSQSIDALASHDEQPQRREPPVQIHRPAPAHERRSAPRETPPANSDEGATNKQIQYLLGIGRRQGLSTNQLESRIQQVLRKEVGLYDLTKREAAQVIDALTGSATNGRQVAR